MSWDSLRSMIDRYPGLKARLKPIYYGLKREPMVLQTDLSGRGLAACLQTDSPTILEVGCNEGDTTRWLEATFPDARIFCFEPDPRAIDRFREEVGERPNIDLIETAVGAADGTVTFFASGGHPDGSSVEWDASGSIRAPKKHLELHPWCTFDRTIEVPICKLDTWCEANGVGAVDFIWMDVQGAELDVIRGARRTLERTRFLYTEYSNQELYEGQLPLKGLLAELESFEVIARYPNDLLVASKTLVTRRVRRQLRAAFRSQDSTIGS